MKLFRALIAKFKHKFLWEYIITGHEQGVIDGVGRKTKYLVRVKVLSKKYQRTVVQSSVDFAKTANLFMEKTVVFHIFRRDEQENY